MNRDNTFANYAEANRSFWRQTVLPLVGRTAQALARWLAPDEPGLRLAPDLDRIVALADEREALWRRVGAASFLTDDEKRAAVGYGAAGAGKSIDITVTPSHWETQPRIPEGNPGGGQWTDAAGAGVAVAQLVGSTVSDAIALGAEQLGKLLSGGGTGHGAQTDTAEDEQLQRVLKHLSDSAHTASTGRCAQYVRQALAAGGIVVEKPAARPGNNAASAADFGPSLVKAGASLVADVQGQDVGAEPAGFPPDGYAAKPGDVIVFPTFPGHPHGHMAMWTGERWISDFRQYAPWPNQTRAKAYGPSYRVYRFMGFHGT